MMRTLVSSLSGLILIVLVSITSMGGCKSGDSCDFTFNLFTNGGSPGAQDSEWECERGGEQVFTIAFFGDGTGFRSDAGEFVWEQKHCRVVDFETIALETGTFEDIEGSIGTVGDTTYGSLYLEQVSDDLGDITVGCSYNEF